MFAAEQQLECAGGIEDTPFVTVRVTVDEDSQSTVEAFQVSKQCMEMAAEGVLQASPHLGACAVNDTFTAIVEGRPSKEVRVSTNCKSLVHLPTGGQQLLSGDDSNSAIRIRISGEHVPSRQSHRRVADS